METGVSRVGDTTPGRAAPGLGLRFGTEPVCVLRLQYKPHLHSIHFAISALTQSSE